MLRLSQAPFPWIRTSTRREMQVRLCVDLISPCLICRTSAWTLFAAAYMGNDAQSDLINGLWSLVANNATDLGIFPTRFSLGSGGDFSAGRSVSGEIP